MKLIKRFIRWIKRLWANRKHEKVDVLEFEPIRHTPKKSKKVLRWRRRREIADKSRRRNRRRK